ncbi:hypothetical protein 32HC_2 [Mycobacterium phage 32HC]|uniref:Uncharacterized protein n=1 Tax=Mycobacterium phage 32HC TaxID=1445729 RepID=W8EH82_9CAUD|nr:hypothetical protein ST32HC_2 [Mycobacterium phage 32HC]AHJ86280.1 hypothetical protein 32HC_2 [Mycobacterium phage 32HC]
MNEIEISTHPDTFAMTRFGQIGSPPAFGSGLLLTTVNPIILVRAEDVGASLRPSGDDTYGGVVATVTPDGMFRIDSASGSWVWELFPARFDDDSDPYGPACYVAVWRD